MRGAHKLQLRLLERSGGVPFESVLDIPPDRGSFGNRLGRRPQGHRGVFALAAAGRDVAGMVVSFWFLALAMRHIPLGTAYAVRTGIGAVGTVILGMILFGESRDFSWLACIALILAGVVGLKWLSGTDAAQ